MQGCECREREKENSPESPEGQSDSGSCDKAHTQQLDPAVNSFFNVCPLTLRGGTPFTLPVSLSMFVSLHSFTLSVQTSYLSPLPFPTLLCPFCDPVSPLCFPQIPSGVVTYIGAGESRTPSAWGHSVVMGMTRGWVTYRSYSDQAQDYLI